MKTNKTHIIAILVILVLSFFASWYLIRPGFFAMHDDLQIMRFYQLERCFADGQIPCRWVPDMGSGFGFPLFNYYSPLPYYFGMLFRWLGFSFMTVTNYTFLSSMIISGIAMYVLVYRITKSRLAGFLSSIMYIWAPYRSVQIFVRGALAESFALALFPVVLLTIWEFAHQPKNKFNIWLPLSFAALYLSHNIMAMWFTPVILGFALLSLTMAHNLSLKKTLMFSIYYLWGLSLAGFFLIPALVEKSLVKTETLTQDYFNFRLHFATVKQLFIDRQWGYGPSRPGPVDDMSFQIGIVHWIVGGFSVLLSAWKIFRQKNLNNLLWVFFSFLFLLFIFLIHSKSVLLWEMIPLLSLTQFPWRLLSFVNLFSSILAGYLISNLRNTKIRLILLTVIVISTVSLSWSYFKPDKYDPNAIDSNKLQTEWQKQQIGSIRDFLPNSVSTYDIPISDNKPYSLTSEGFIDAKNLHIWSDHFSLDVEVSGVDQAQVIVPVFNFPQWEVIVSDQPVMVASNQPLGLISFQVPQGKHIVTGWFRNTPIRLIANSLTLISLSLLIFVAIIAKHRQTK